MSQSRSHQHVSISSLLAFIQTIRSYRSYERTQCSRWQRPVVGYIFALLITCASIGVTFLGETLQHGFYLPTAFLLVALLLVALGWGTGPALLTLFVSGTVLSFLAFFPDISHMQTPLIWDLLFDLLPFALAGLTVALLTANLERARQRARRAEQLSQERAQELGTLNEELKQADIVKNQFLSMASHELKTPLTSMHGLVQLEQRRLAKQGADALELYPLRDTLHKIDQQNRRLLDLINDLLDINSLRSGHVPMDMTPCDLNTICMEIVAEQRLLSKRSILAELPSAPVLLHADAIRIGQVLTNLISNALKYSPAESEVTVRVERELCRACVCVEDHGKGIPEQQRQKIFEPFYRTHDARSSRVSGTGLGLSICHDIVIRHHGQIWCESQPGRGSTFFVALPLSGQAETAESSST